MEKKKRQLIFVRICCIFASFCLWLYISNWENPIDTYKLKNIPVELINTDALEQSKLTVIPGQNFNVSLNIRGVSLAVMKAKPADFKVVADMSLYVLKKGLNKIPVQIVTYPSNINIENSNTMWVEVELDDLAQKSVPVKTKIQGSPKSGYYYFDGTPNATEVKVSGPKKYVDMVSEAVGTVNINGLSKDTELNASLEAHDTSGKVVSNVKLSPNNVSISVPIKKGKNVSVNLKTKGTAANGINVKDISLEQQSVQICGDENTVSNISSINTLPIDLSTIEDSKELKAKLDLPKGVSLTSGNEYVAVNVSIEKTIQKTVSVNINILNLDSKYNAVLDSSTAAVTISGSETAVNAIKDGDIKCTVDASTLIEGTHSLKIAAAVPQGITMVSVVPGMGNVNMTKK